ncbi:MAG: DNA double-strand break repair nuclease NurA [Candidatus Odinarchaeum yellowstonii]|uniref:DNA double-strand break repair nuclease NurA n=1 Tax=Odinarchaeota yellowstonii (strain LCB_4) TaxID=1841599 RepID=A0AAF0D2B5_ODILC|nr:MAG: DNA double-strand break repair nuclease NurA [Candidatus Odinarchaeum yellowstonii]
MHDVETGTPFFVHPPYKIYNIEANRFHHIKKFDSRRKIVFVDGGNNSLLEGAGFSIQYNRVYFAIFENGLRVRSNRMPERVEFLSASVKVFKDEHPFFETIIYPLNNEFKSCLPFETDLFFDSTDKCFRLGLFEVDFSRISSMARRFAELQVAYHLVENEMDEGDILVLDRTLQTSYTNESKYSEKLFQSANDRGIIVSGLAKTNRLYTTTGMGLLEAVQMIAKNVNYDRWYILLAESTSKDHNAAIFIVKLNPLSEYVFRYEILYDQYSKLSEEALNEIFWKVSENSADLCFPGYPYGLIAADMFARVRTDEVEAYRTILLSELSKNERFDKFLRRVRAVNAHDVLNFLASESGGNLNWML